MPTEVAIVSPGAVDSPSPSPPPSPSSEEWTPVTVSGPRRGLKNDQSGSSVLEDEDLRCESTSPLPSLVSASPKSSARTPEPPLPVEDTSGTLYWNASFLYHTGLALSPKIKTQNLRSSVSMSDMNRSRSPALPKYLTKSPSNDSGTGTTTTVGSSEEQMSPLRRRHLSCSSSSSGSLGSLKKGAKVSGSMRLMKALGRPSLSNFMEKTQSLGRYSGSKAKSVVSPLSRTQVEEEQSSSTISEGGGTSASTSTSGGSSTVRKALRDSFRAAKNLLPLSSKSGKEGRKEVTSSSTLSLSDTTESGSTINQSESPKATIRGLRGSLSKVESKKESKSNLKSFLSRSKTNLAKSLECLDEGNKRKSPKESEEVGETSKGKKDKEISKKEKKEAEKASEEKSSPKKVSLVKSLKNKMRSRSKERKEKATSSEPKTSKEAKNRSASQEIVNFDNEPRVRTPKTVRHRYSSTPEKDRDLNEMEVRGEAIETSAEGLEVKGDDDAEVVRSIVEGSKVGGGSKKGKKKGAKDKKKGGGSKVTTTASASSDLPELKLLDTKLDLDEEINESSAAKVSHEDLSGRQEDGDGEIKDAHDEGISEVVDEGKRRVLTADEEVGEVAGASSQSTNVEIAEEMGKTVPGSEDANVDDDEEPSCTESFRQLKPFNFDLDPISEGKRERLYKVLVVGELGAGKTSIIKRYVHQFFSQHYRATIGVDFALKVLRWDPDTVVRLQLWDIAGQERFGSMTRVYYKEAVGAFVVFDVTRAGTLEAVPKWKADLDSKVALPDGRPIPTVLLANKSDQPKEGIAANREKMNDFCQQQGFSAWFETSAKENINIDESANFLVSKILEMDRWSQEPINTDPDKVDLSANGKHKPSSSSNCLC